ncbi:MAG: intradiol ring-cleavage dioxygenase [Anaerolineae bacterium]|nr:intradiol ring-cleavage dioxygenase [Anaerolineae bacterium]
MQDNRNLVQHPQPEADDPDNDDRQIGQILSRREVLRLLGISGAALLAGCSVAQSTSPAATDAAAVSTTAATVPAATTAAGAATAVPACVVRPEVTEGPYYVNEDLNRSDVRSDTATGAIKDGALLALTFNVTQVSENSCTPLEGAKVEIWHCDAAGVYSDVSDPGFDTEGHDFLRGYQVTDANGQATFTTIYPGWYSSRCVHIHFKVHDTDAEDSKVFTSQLFFDDSLTDQVFTQAPYAEKGQRDTLNSTDDIYQDLLLLNTSQTAEGYAAAFDIGLDLSTMGTGSSEGRPGGGPPPGGPGGRPPGGNPPPQGGG